MNGARTTFMRRGYLLTALAAAVLLAASTGTAQAQPAGVASHGEGGVLVTVPRTVTEGESTTVSVSVQAIVSPGTAATDVTVTIGALDPQIANPRDPRVTKADGTAGDDDFDISGGTVTLSFPAVAAAADGGVATTYTRRGAATLRTEFDRDAESEYASLTVTVAGLASPPTVANKAITIDDVDTQTYALSLNRGDTYMEGGMVDVVVAAVPGHVERSQTLSLRVADQDGNVQRLYATGGVASVSVGNVTATDGADATDEENAQSVQISVPANDRNRVTDTIVIEALAGTPGDYVMVDSVEATVLDNHMLPGSDAITAVAMDKARNGERVTEITEGGDPVYLTITVDRGTARSRITDEALTVEIQPADAAQATDYDLSVSRISLDGQATGKQSNDVGLEVMLSALSDEDVGAEDLVLNLVVSGDAANGTDTSTGTFTLAVVDDTEKKIWPLPEDEAYPAIMTAMDAAAGDNGFNPGESFMVMTSDLFGVAEGYTASYKASVEGEAVSISASGDSIKVNAEMAGESKVTVTATAAMASSSFKADQTVSDVASITFPVTVADKALEVMLEMPAGVMDGNIVEGSDYDITVMANRAVAEDTEVMIMRDRSMSDADDDDFTVTSATIMAGEDMATATLTVLEDNMPDAGTNDNMGEQLVLYGEVNGQETNSLTFTIWDVAVPALPLIAQLALALFLALGGARLYRRRQG